MDVVLDYGKHGLPLRLPEDANLTVIHPRNVNPLPAPLSALRDALHHPMGSEPLREHVRSSHSVAIVFSDITRATPNHVILPAILEELAHVPAQNIVLCNALGTHRRNTPEELARMLGSDIARTYRIEQNNCFDPSTQVYLGVSSKGHPIWINRAYLEADVKILTGFIEPHFFAGFSGGGKAVMPGMAGQKTVLGNHDAGMIGNPKATWGVTYGNPIWEEAREVALKTHPTFLLNVTLNRAKQITNVFAGDLVTAHDAGIEFVRDTSMVPVDDLFDMVLTTNSGYPLDLNLYQCGKGMSAAEQIVRQGGSIIMAAECAEGIPDHGLFGEMLRAANSPQELYDNVMKSPETRQDQWAAQIQARIQLKADVYLYSDHFTDAQIREALLVPCRDIPATVELLRQKYGHDARICVLPEGPQTIPYLAPRDEPVNT
jgi:nickel-dependent lactate racemase